MVAHRTSQHFISPLRFLVVLKIGDYKYRKKEMNCELVSNMLR